MFYRIRPRPQRLNQHQNKISLQPYETAACLFRRRCASRCAAVFLSQTAYRNKYGSSPHGIRDAAVFSFSDV